MSKKKKPEPIHKDCVFYKENVVGDVRKWAEAQATLKKCVALNDSASCVDCWAYKSKKEWWLRSFFNFNMKGMNPKQNLVWEAVRREKK